jgi:diguanylate cyclase (GGDEF)-like protein
MSEFIPILGDICVIFFDLLIYTRMITLKNDKRYSRIIMYMGCGIIIAAYFIAAYLLEWPASVASAICMTLPSLLMFFILSKYKDARFFLTFCFVDTVTLILAFIARYIGVLCGDVGGIAAILVLLASCLTVFFACRPYFGKYRELLECVKNGWSSIMVSSLLIYFALIFVAAYPKPLVERVEYGPVYLVISVTLLSCYAVFLTFIVQTKKVYDQSRLLQEEKKWHQMAYVDALTGKSNRMAYMAKINELERIRTREMQIGILMFDLDNFKKVNDTLGHNEGDRVLKKTADLLENIFCEENYSLFRIGGDEFAVIAENVLKEQLEEKLGDLNQILTKQDSCNISAGYAMICPDENNAVEQAFIRADVMMYQNKRNRKEGEKI